MARVFNYVNYQLAKTEDTDCKRCMLDNQGVLNSFHYNENEKCDTFTQPSVFENCYIKTNYSWIEPYFASTNYKV